MNNARGYSSIETVRTRRSSGWLAVSLLSVGCVVPRPEAKLPTTGGTYVAVLSGEMPPPIDTVARHSWIVTHRTGSTEFRRFELGSEEMPTPSETSPRATSWSMASSK